eukprot:CAMPEP_0202964428 /NCGR_PEP_ID=MMETSP1396-20130829/8509_1 /ASSEMBLY_ACC=CAM_ASM_000872 /TAXON_ID= /ORGANISM="Pseudokeronopsis sp., Strain Brazil" /LENGTH=44 /DNA_ID= /DNA_START= /DNA_END= /DNA_ORIENTATION=
MPNLVSTVPISSTLHNFKRPHQDSQEDESPLDMGVEFYNVEVEF